jgi:hypothetical protein
MDAATLTAVALVITAIGSAISAIATFYNIAISKRAVVVSEANSVHMLKVEAATNGMKTDLVNEVRKASFAAGAKSEKDKK